MLHNIERVTKQKIEQIDLPSFEDIDAKARERLIAQLRSVRKRNTTLARMMPLSS